MHNLKFSGSLSFSGSMERNFTGSMTPGQWVYLRWLAKLGLIETARILYADNYYRSSVHRLVDKILKESD